MNENDSKAPKKKIVVDDGSIKKLEVSESEDGEENETIPGNPQDVMRPKPPPRPD
jgi:hypothetical protein